MHYKDIPEPAMKKSFMSTDEAENGDHAALCLKGSGAVFDWF